MAGQYLTEQKSGSGLGIAVRGSGSTLQFSHGGRDEGFDALLTPATNITAPGPETTGDPRFNMPWSYSGQPTVSFPCGLTEEGMPAALQLIGRSFDEPALFAAAAWCEQVLQFHDIPPMLSQSG